VTKLSNPFEYEAATNLPSEVIADVYVDDFNFSRFILTTRNIILVGERGSGKSMTLLYNSLRVQLAGPRDGKTDLGMVGVYVPCKTTLIHRIEYELMPAPRAMAISEHLFVLSILYAIAETLELIPEPLSEAEQKILAEETEYLLGLALRPNRPFFAELKSSIEKESSATQKLLNKLDPHALPENLFSFSSGVLPLINVLRRAEKLKNSHFMLMIDDAHDLNTHQARALNSWIAYRDRSAFSFKVATADTGRHGFLTASGGAILEGHDFTEVNMYAPLQKKTSSFGKLAAQIIEKRLSRAGIDSTPEAFFPTDPTFERDLAAAMDEVREEAKGKMPGVSGKRLSDYVHKFSRVRYFRNRPAKANRPPYSGFDTLVYLSTGVIRNLLEPCFWMYDAMQSEVQEKGRDPALISSIPSDIQTDIIMKQSDKAWKRLRDGLDRSIDGCTTGQAKQIVNLFIALADLFQHRLITHRSEPQAKSFSISGLSDPGMRTRFEKDLAPLLDVARRAQLLYIRIGPAKERGRREPYYVPNRVLWPSVGLDVHGQHARVSLSVKDLLDATAGRSIIRSGDEGLEDFSDMPLFAEKQEASDD
jgi:hypothetical protein